MFTAQSLRPTKTDGRPNATTNGEPARTSRDQNTVKLVKKPVFGKNSRRVRICYIFVMLFFNNSSIIFRIAWCYKFISIMNIQLNLRIIKLNFFVICIPKKESHARKMKLSPEK